MAGLAAQALTIGGFTAALVAFVVAGSTLVLLILAAAVGVAMGQEAAVERLRATAPSVKRWGGWVLVTVGAWFLVLSVFSEPLAGLFPV